MQGNAIKTIKDFGEGFADRYLVQFGSGEIYYMSADADAPNGCCIYDDGKFFGSKGGKKTNFSDLPVGTRRQIYYIQETWGNGGEINR